MTDHNPYMPPSTTVAEDRNVAPPPSKPWAVTIAQGLGAIVAVMLAVGITRYFYGMWEWSKVGVTMIWMPSHTGYRIAVLILLMVMLFQLPKRSQIGRWCGVLLLVIAFSSVTYLAATTDLSSMQTPGQRAGFLFSVIVTLGPIAWLLYAFAFSRKAKAYFGVPARN